MPAISTGPATPKTRSAKLRGDALKKAPNLTSLAARGTFCLGTLAAWGCGGADSSAAPPPATDGGADSAIEVDSGVTFDASPPTGCAPDCPNTNLARGTSQQGLNAYSL